MQSSNKAALIMLFCALTSSSWRSFVDSAPVGPEGNPEEVKSTAQDSSVKELENLKHSLGNTLELMKSQSSVYANENRQKKALPDVEEQAVTENGKIVARQHLDIQPTKDEVVKTKVDIKPNLQRDSVRHILIHKSGLPADYPALTENGNRRSVPLANNLNTGIETGNTVDKVDNLSGVQYSPLDMAEYVFWTGDEKGVTLAIEEFLQEGLMTREEAIAFLQEIKYNLEYLKGHYTQLGLNGREHSKDVESVVKQHQQQQEHLGFGKSRSSYETPELRNNFDINQLRQEVSKKRTVEPSTQTLPLFNKAVDTDKVQQQDDYDELLERLRVADFLYNRIFVRGSNLSTGEGDVYTKLDKSSTEAQQALQKFTNFLEMEAEQGHISRALEKKVLDVLIASLSDTLTEHPELLAAARESLDSSSTNSGAVTTTTAADGHHFIRQILDLNLDDKQQQPFAVPSDFYTYKSQQSNNRNTGLFRNQQNIKLDAGHVPIGLGKYKNP